MSLHVKNFGKPDSNTLKMNLSTKIFFKKRTKVDIKSYRPLIAPPKESRKFLILSIFSISSVIALIHQLFGSYPWSFSFYSSHPLNKNGFLIFSNTNSLRASDSRKVAVSVAGIKRRQGKEERE